MNTKFEPVMDQVSDPSNSFTQLISFLKKNNILIKRKSRKHNTDKLKWAFFAPHQCSY